MDAGAAPFRERLAYLVMALAYPGGMGFGDVKLAGVLGLRLVAPQSQAQEAAPFIELLIELRAELRKAKQFALADMVRTRLTELDITLEDGPQGTRWKMTR